ncbi:T9SS type A sorting domain-containing protein [Aureibaculum sp. 2210JD6-5]|uniref:T9SS type A sorting domain-containing protein n=1 Tax=Aureibaculum sp. 2210JD6-5 TaxID=3103957 RepID=UPI002AAD4672|nr:T9SS type A sorting domain-containing protein [Aureibaculum sp. 2210JD6-5]MDY7396917.1 T9SS type A sorting domain-containing protein [Aureibaculum sp. 2210JD6-5]
MKELLLLFLSLGLSLHAATFKVGSSRIYKSPNDLYNANVLQDGDIIEIDAETFEGQPALAVWSKNNLIIRGVGGKPHLVANGLNIWGKGIWVLAGNNITVENIEFSGATVPDKNGAGIRLDGDGMTVSNCYFHDNENGILTANSGAGDIIIEHTEFENNGFGDGQSHNLYIGRVNSLTFRYNYSHHAKIGHNLKSRANENYILYNRIMDEETGFSSRLIDLPNGGLSLIMGNVLMQGPNAENNNLIGYGLEGLTNPISHNLLVINNTMVNKRVASCIFISIQSGTNSSAIHNNIFAGSGTLLSGTATLMTNNLAESNINSVLFVNESNYDYRIESNSPAVNAGLSIDPFLGNSLIPNQHYVHPNNVATRTNIGVIDIGAYESGATLSLSDTSIKNFSVYPNPASNYLTIKTEAIIKEIVIYNVLGQSVFTKSYTDRIDVSELEDGIYYLKIIGDDVSDAVVAFIKK